MGGEISEKAIRCLRHLEAYDFTGMRAMCTDTATVWHNDGKGEQTIDGKLEQLKPLVTAVDSLRYEIGRQFQNSNEVLQQQVLHLAMRDGSRIELHAMMYFRFRDGLVDRIEEYVYPVPADGNAPGDGARA
ncbi:SnoaL-like domain-containing protein [Sinosporangium album]|uniref:SnoaL-like domain-containing protein n=1 Tax=Sinosporangium album TaxID=504805 RepID=A0A1G7TBL9_9ACTN|nr:nuclear transport factor 2 family protein [Sinosporangium album]SDG32444.1 SnoaL-like domain-containing protein [Sinosporangium album]